VSSIGRLLRGRDDTRPWTGGYQPYDLIKEAAIALVVVAGLAVVLTILFSSPDDPPSTIAQWSHKLPVNFATTGAQELAGTSETAEYGPPYNSASEGQHAGPIYLQKWLGVSHPIDTAHDMVIGPLSRVPQPPNVQAALAAWRGAPEATRRAWAKSYSEALEGEAEATPNATSVSVKPGNYGPVPTIVSALSALAQSGGLEGALLVTDRFYNNDYTLPLLFMANGALLEERAAYYHLGGDEWGMMNETGSYPGQVWLWLYTFWYQIEPFKGSENADILVLLIMGLLSLAFICIPFIPGVRDLPRWIPIYRLIWREHYRDQQLRAGP